MPPKDITTESPRNPNPVRVLTLDRYAPGMRGDARTRAVDLDRALAKAWPDDRHFVAYAPLALEAGRAPVRLTTRDGVDKVTGEKIPSVWAYGVTVSVQLLIGDVDPPGHEATPEWREENAARLIASGLAHYQTRNGFRIVQPLAQPITLECEADAAEWTAFYLAWCDSLEEAHGLTLDHACKDWTRLYRLPNVRRDGKAERADLIGALVPMPVETMSGLAERAERNATAARPKPRAKGSRDASTEALDRAHALAGTLAPSVEGHGGDAALFAAASEIATVLGTDEDAIRTVLEETFNPRCAPPWPPSKLHLEARRAAVRQSDPMVEMRRRIKARREAAEAEAAAEDDGAYRVATGGGGDDGRDAAGETMPLLLRSRDDRTILIYEGDDRGYAPIGLGTVRNRIAELGYEYLIPLSGPKGARIAPPEILDQAVTYETTRYSYQPNTVYDASGDGTVTIGLRAPSIAGVFDPRVDRWLRAIGGAHYPRFEQWLASCHPKWVAADEPRLAAMLILMGPKSLGKSLLATALARLWGAIAAPPLGLLRSQFNSAMIKCPVLVDEEAKLMGSREFSTKDLRDAIQSRIRHVEPKGKERCDLIGTQRYIVPCNGPSDLKLRDLTDGAVIDAVTDRVLLLDLAERDAEIKDALGDLLDGSEADVASIVRHLAWLGETVDIDPEDRFAGSGGNRVEKALLEGHGASYAELTARLRRWADGDEDPALKVVGRRLYANCEGLIPCGMYGAPLHGWTLGTRTKRQRFGSERHHAWELDPARLGTVLGAKKIRRLLGLD